MTYTLSSSTRRRGMTTNPDPGWTYYTAAPVGPSGLRPPIPPGYMVWWFEPFAYADRNAMLAAQFNGSPVWTVYSGQDSAYASGYWAQSHVTVSGGLLTLTGSFDTSADATRYVTGGVGAWGLAGNGNAPAGALWLYCAREESAGGQPIKTAAMTYGAQYPWAGQFAKAGSAAGSGYAEWPYCGEVDMTEGTQGASTVETWLHWHEPASVNDGNKNGHTQLRVGQLNVDKTKWHIGGYRVDAAGLYQGWTNDAGTVDAPLRKWIEQAGVNEAFRRAGRSFIYQQEAYGQPAAGTGTVKVYLDWVACLVPVAKGIHTPPGAIIDLHQSKFTLPVDASNGNGTPPKEIFNPQLQTYMHGSFFQADATGTAVVMTANAGGAHTGGSLYARAEERGMNLDSTVEESFGGNDGKIHTRILTQKILHLPDHRPEVVCSQIHGDDDDPAVISSSFLLIYASGFWPSTAGSTTYVKGGETAPFKIILKINAMDGSGAVINAPVLSDIRLGDTFSTKLVMGGGQVLVYMDKGDKGAAGATTLVRTVTTEIPTKGAYFKAGTYNQSNPNNDGEGKKVPNGTAATGGNLTGPIAAGQPTGNATSAEYGQVATLYQKTTHVAGGGGTPPAGAPSDVLTLNGATPWKITLPIRPDGSLGNGSGSPLEILLPDLIGYKKDPYYIAQKAPDGVDEAVFWAPANGATTSGSSNPRTEYREMAGSSGTSQAAWSTSSGTHTLYLVGRVLQLPTNKPQVVIAQIHDPADDFTFMADGFSPTDNGNAVNDTDTGGFCIVWRNWAGTQQYTQPVIAGVHIGDVYSLMMRVTAGGNIGIYGALGVVSQAALITAGAVTTYAGGNKSGCYFKAGAYTQANSSNSGKSVPSGHYSGLPTLTSPAPGSAISGEPTGSGGKIAIRQLTFSHT